jgi:hypothetical protein
MKLIRYAGNIETGEEIRTLRGHTRGIRALQFDDSKLISGSLDSKLPCLSDGMSNTC